MSKQLTKKIENVLLENLSDQIVFSDYFCWDNQTVDGAIVSETLFDWSNPTINFPINELNLKLWKEYLKTGDYRLKDFNNWNTHIDRQKEVCKKVNADWKPINPKHKIGVSSDLNGEPIHGLRHEPEKGTTGWYIWTGDYSERADFFKPLHAGHLLEKRPDLIKYLGLPPGYRFLIDEKGYEDIWEDKQLLNADDTCVNNGYKALLLINNFLKDKSNASEPSDIYDSTKSPIKNFLLVIHREFRV